MIAGQPARGCEARAAPDERKPCAIHRRSGAPGTKMHSPTQEPETATAALDSGTALRREVGEQGTPLPCRPTLPRGRLPWPLRPTAGGRANVERTGRGFVRSPAGQRSGLAPTPQAGRPADPAPRPGDVCRKGRMPGGSGRAGTPTGRPTVPPGPMPGADRDAGERPIVSEGVGEQRRPARNGALANLDVVANRVLPVKRLHGVGRRPRARQLEATPDTLEPWLPLRVVTVQGGPARTPAGRGQGLRCTRTPRCLGRGERGWKLGAPDQDAGTRTASRPRTGLHTW